MSRFFSNRCGSVGGGAGALQGRTGTVHRFPPPLARGGATVGIVLPNSCPFLVGRWVHFEQQATSNGKTVCFAFIVDQRFSIPHSNKIFYCAAQIDKLRKRKKKKKWLTVGKNVPIVTASLRSLVAELTVRTAGGRGSGTGEGGKKGVEQDLKMAVQGV